MILSRSWISVIILMSLCAISHADVNEFERSVHEGYTVYSKKEPGGAVSELVINHTQNLNRISYSYSACDFFTPECAKNRRGLRIPDIDKKAVESFSAIIDHYKLKDKDEFRSRKKIIVRYFEDGVITHAPFIRYINDDDSYPANIMKTYKRENNKAYYAMLRNKILESKIYQPLQNKMWELGCQMKLRRRFTDGWRWNIPKKYFIDAGFFTEDEAKKEYYPSLKHAVHFDLNCENKEQKNDID